MFIKRKEATTVGPTLAAQGIDKHLADRARKYAAIPDQQFETILSERRERENERVTVERAKAAPEFVAKDLQRPVQRTGLAQNH